MGPGGPPSPGLVGALSAWRRGGRRAPLVDHQLGVRSAPEPVYRRGELLGDLDVLDLSSERLGALDDG